MKYDKALKEIFGLMGATVEQDKSVRTVRITIEDSSFTLTFAMLDKLSALFQTKKIDFTHKSGYMYSSYTYESAKSVIRISDIPPAVFE